MRLKDLVRKLQMEAFGATGYQGGGEWTTMGARDCILIMAHWSDLRYWHLYLKLPGTRAILRGMTQVLAQPPLARYLTHDA